MRPLDLLQTNNIPERVYTARDLIEVEGKLRLPITLERWKFGLPIVNVGTEDSPVGIAFLDAHPHRNPMLSRACEVTVEDQLRSLGDDLYVVRAGTKKAFFIDRAVRNYKRSGHRVSLNELPAGANRLKVLLKSQQGTVDSYHPVTGEKFMGRKRGQREAVQEHLRQGKKVVLMDDVRTTSSTFNEMCNQLGISLDNPLVYTVEIAREAPLDPNYPPVLSARESAAIALPEIPDGLDPKKMYSIADRKSIPRAFVR